MECQKAPLKKLNNGSFKAVVNLEACVLHELRYIVDDVYLHDDVAGSENGCVKFVAKMVTFSPDTSGFNILIKYYLCLFNFYLKLSALY